MKQNTTKSPFHNIGVKRDFKKFKADKHKRRCHRCKKTGHTVD